MWMLLYALLASPRAAHAVFGMGDEVTKSLERLPSKVRSPILMVARGRSCLRHGCHAWAGHRFRQQPSLAAARIKRANRQARCFDCELGTIGESLGQLSEEAPISCPRLEFPLHDVLVRALGTLHFVQINNSIKTPGHKRENANLGTL